MCFCLFLFALLCLTVLLHASCLLVTACRCLSVWAVLPALRHLATRVLTSAASTQWCFCTSRNSAATPGRLDATQPRKEIYAVTCTAERCSALPYGHLLKYLGGVGAEAGWGNKPWRFLTACALSSVCASGMPWWAHSGVMV